MIRVFTRLLISYSRKRICVVFAAFSLFVFGFCFAMFAQSVARMENAGAGGGDVAPSAVVNDVEVPLLPDRVGEITLRLPECASVLFGPPLTMIEITPEKLPDWVNDADRGKKIETPQARAQSFAALWASSGWNSEDASNPSGRGSSHAASLRAAWMVVHAIDYVRRALKLPHSEPVRILDAPCGDMKWMGPLVSKMSGVQYRGIDIVPKAIEKHKSSFASFPHMSFQVLDVVESPLDSTFRPHLIFSRHMLQHLTNDAAARALQHLRSSSASFLLLTDYPDWLLGGDRNDLPTTADGRIRKLNLRLPPLNMPDPMCVAHDFSESFLAFFNVAPSG